MAKKLDPQAFGTKSMSQRDVMAKSMGMSPGMPKAKPKVSMGPFTNTTIGGKPVKMSPAKIEARRKTTISNAATKVMGGQYSK